MCLANSKTTIHFICIDLLTASSYFINKYYLYVLYYIKYSEIKAFNNKPFLITRPQNDIIIYLRSHMKQSTNTCQLHTKQTYFLILLRITKSEKILFVIQVGTSEHAILALDEVFWSDCLRKSVSILPWTNIYITILQCNRINITDCLYGS